MADKVDRIARVNELLLREIAGLIEKDIMVPSGMMMSVIEVKTSGDLHNATVYISIFGGTVTEQRKLFAELLRHRVVFQRRIAAATGFKHTPVLAFKTDDRLQRGDAVFAMLNDGDK